MAAEFGVAELQKLTVLELQEELKRRGLKKTGVKATLIERLLEHMHQSKDKDEGASEEPGKEPHPYVAECGQQFVDDSDTSVDNYSNPMFTKENTEIACENMQEIQQQNENSVSALNDDTSNYDDPRDFAEEFTNPIHKSPQKNPSENRFVEMSEESLNYDESRDAHSESSNDELANSVAVIHQFNRSEEESNSHDPQEESHSLLPKEESNQSEIYQDENEMDSEKYTRDQRYDNVAEDEEKGDNENMKIVSNVSQEEKHMEEDVLDYGEMDEDLNHKEDADDEEKPETKLAKSKTNRKHLSMTIEEKQTPADESIKLKKVVLPVHLKKRVSLKALNETPEEKAARRKRRWGSTSIKDSSVAISTESIKKLMPDVKIDAAVLESAPELDYHEENIEKSLDVKLEENSATEQAGGKDTPTKKRRTVKLDTAKKVTLGNPLPTEAVPIDSNAGEKPSHSARPVEIDDDIEPTTEREKSPSPAKNPPSCYLHIENLVRPFTVNQLKALIRKIAVLEDEFFWINNIKSHCYLMVSSEKEAIATREALHGINWPSGSPKTLRVDYAIMEKMWSDTDGKLGKKPKDVIEIDDKENYIEKPSTKGKERPSRPKSGEDEGRKRQEQREEKVKQKKESKKEREESPAKLLDNLFRKTKATPCIYWLPLTEEQIIEKEKANKKPEIATKSTDRKSPVRGSPVQRQQQRRDRGGWR